MEENLQEKLAKERTVMAAERTFAAWLRTGLSGIAGGLAIIKLIPFRNALNQKLSYVAGLLLICWGIYTIYINYSRHSKYLNQMNWESTNYGSDKFGFTTIVLMVISVIILVVSLIHIFEGM